MRRKLLRGATTTREGNDRSARHTTLREIENSLQLQYLLPTCLNYQRISASSASNHSYIIPVLYAVVLISLLVLVSLVGNKRELAVGFEYYPLYFL